MAELVNPDRPNEKKRKRPRAARACELCRAKKYRCDEMWPCSQCKRQKVECVYDVADHVRQRMIQFNKEPTMQPDQSNATSAHAPREGNDRMPEERSNAVVSNESILTPLRSPVSAQWTQVNTGLSATHRSLLGEVSTNHGDQVDEDHDVEVSDVNPHTQNVEFHGKTSSIAFLAALQPKTPQSGGNPSPGDQIAHGNQPSLVSIFHNEAFSPETLANTQHDAVVLESERYYFRQAQVFLDGFFQNLHFVHPILDRRSFMNRCEDLWFGKADRQPKSFVALYYSIMSLGALIKTWDEDKFDGLGRLEWSRKFFNLTRTAIGGLASMTALESVQCLFFMAKISQNELNPSLAYLYLGWATRASCSAGFNRRQTSSANEIGSKSDQVAKLWWGLYSLEIEVSFALGRPDSLSADAYHNQIMPALDESETAVITVMVHFARIIRDVSLSIYLSSDTLQEKTLKASEIEVKMDNWLQSIPDIIKPSIFEMSKSHKIMKSPTWAKRQRLVLELRFYNVKMVLFRPFLTVAAKYRQNISLEVSEAIKKCVNAATSTIELMHEMYCHHAFFRTWWYNTTYILYAASIVLCYGIKVAQSEERITYIKLGQKAVEILDAMEESTVAKNASLAVQQILESANDVSEFEQSGLSHEKAIDQTKATDDAGMSNFAQFADDSLMSFLNLDENLDFLAMTFPLNSSHFPFWSDGGDDP